MVSKALDKSSTCFGEEKCVNNNNNNNNNLYYAFIRVHIFVIGVGTIHKTVSKCGQRSILCSNKRWWKVQNKRRSVFQRKRRHFIKRVWLRQKVLGQKMKTALGVIGVEGFLFQLSPLKTKRALPIPAVEFTEPAPSVAKIFLTKGTESMQRQTNFSPQNFVAYFNKPG